MNWFFWLGGAAALLGGGIGVRRVLYDQRIEAIAAATGVPRDVLAAFAVVESRGNDAAVRFECHRWNDRAADRGLPTVPCTLGPGGWSVTRAQTDRAAAFRAISIDPRLAVESSSWGRYQVMGYTVLSVTGWTPAQFLEYFEADPAAVSDEIVIGWFGQNPGAVRAAKRRDLLLLATLYNGPGQGEHYAGLMAEVLGRETNGDSRG